jgi:DNA-binding transcriptional ArsR family regulator
MVTATNESLESRLYDWLKRACITAENGEYADLDEITEGLASTADELSPVIERGEAQKKLTHTWRKGVKLYTLTTERYLAEKADAAQRGEKVLSEWFEGFDGEPGAKKTGKPGAKISGRPSKEKTPRLTWRYAPVPLAIVDDRNLSAVAVRIAAIVARSINLGKWNTDLHVDIDAGKLGEVASLSRSTTMRAIAELKEAGYIKTESQGRGGIRFSFTDQC